MNVPADIHVYFVLTEYRIESLLHIQAFAVVLRSFSVDGVVSGYDNPVFFCGGQYGVYPGELFLRYLSIMGAVSIQTIRIVIPLSSNAFV